MVTSHGEVLMDRMDDWFGDPSSEEASVLGRVKPPVLDVGCGPGRHVLALARRGMLALGVDAAPTAVDIARDRGAPVLERSVFDPLPGRGRWGSALLLDGNIGIGGDPDRLLRRIADLLAPGGCALVEVAEPDHASRSLAVRLECGNATSPWFSWAVVSASDIERVAETAGFGMNDLWREEGRWFARVTVPSGRG
jgi:SAM-dependent methyltransferase